MGLGQGHHRSGCLPGRLSSPPGVTWLPQRVSWESKAAALVGAALSVTPPSRISTLVRCSQHRAAEGPATHLDLGGIERWVAWKCGKGLWVQLPTAKTVVRLWKLK